MVDYKKDNYKENLLRKVFYKSRDCHGETIAETLVSLLISALALVMLAGVITSSYNVLRKGENKINAYYDENEATVKMTSAGSEESISITDNEVSGTDKLLLDDYPITYYQNDKLGDDRVVITYKKKE